MPENDELHQQIQSLRRELHGVGKPWYERSPGKEIVAHAVAVVTAVGLGLLVHKWTGAPVVIEAKNAPSPTEAPATVVAYTVRETDIVLEDAGAVVVNESPPAKIAGTVVVKRKKTVVVEDQSLSEKLEYAPAAPAAAATVAPAPATAAAAKAAKKAVVGPNDDVIHVPAAAEAW